MAIRLGNSCVNCENYTAEGLCLEHKTMVSKRHTCDSFVMMGALKDDSDCSTCSRYQGPTCANPQKAAPGMLCSHWAPQSAEA